ncbi:MAG: iron chaperone [Fimbriimonas sp.]
MQSKATDVPAYILEAPETRRAALERLAEICREVLVGYDEGMTYGMPTFSRNGQVEVAFASQKNYISLYCLKESIVRDHADLLQGLNVGKGCIRFTKPERMDFNVIRQLIELTFASNEAPC